MGNDGRSSVDEIRRALEVILEARQVAELRALGVRPGMNLLVHSSLKRLGPVDGGAEAVIDALLEAIDPGGTLMMPTHTWKVVTSSQPPTPSPARRPPVASTAVRIHAQIGSSTAEIPGFTSLPVKGCGSDR